jgi:putative oxidoreductase
MEKFTSLLGRILLSQIFLAAVFGKITGPATTQHYMAAYGMPMTGFFLVCAIIVELGGGLSVLLGYKTRWGATILALFLIPVTLIFHTKFSDQTQVIMFMKNLAIIGGLLTLTVAGPGPISVDGHSRQ